MVPKTVLKYIWRVVHFKGNGKFGAILWNLQEKYVAYFIQFFFQLMTIAIEGQNQSFLPENTF